MTEEPTTRFSAPKKVTAPPRQWLVEIGHPAGDGPLGAPATDTEQERRQQQARSSTSESQMLLPFASSLLSPSRSANGRRQPAGAGRTSRLTPAVRPTTLFGFSPIAPRGRPSLGRRASHQVFVLIPEQQCAHWHPQDQRSSQRYGPLLGRRKLLHVVGEVTEISGKLG